MSFVVDECCSAPTRRGRRSSKSSSSRRRHHSRQSPPADEECEVVAAAHALTGLSLAQCQAAAAAEDDDSSGDSDTSSGTSSGTSSDTSSGTSDSDDDSDDGEPVQRRRQTIKSLYRQRPAFALRALAVREVAAAMAREGAHFRLSGRGSKSTHSRIRRQLREWKCRPEQAQRVLRQHGGVTR